MTVPVTKVAMVIGQPVEHSLSPAIHNAAFAATGLDSDEQADFRGVFEASHAVVRATGRGSIVEHRHRDLGAEHDLVGEVDG